jgi:hypothetical protein
MNLFEPLVCDVCDGTEDVSPQLDPWGCHHGGYMCGNCESGQEGMSWHDAMELAHPLVEGTERW